MSAVTATPERTVEEIPDPPSGPSWLLRDSWTEAHRHLQALPRNPELLVFATLQPIMFVVLFVYVFGGSINVPGYDELQAVRDPRDLRPDRAVRFDLHRSRDRRRPEQGLRRTAAFAADVPVGRALRAHHQRRRAQRGVVRGDARGGVPGGVPHRGFDRRGGRGDAPAVRLRVRVLLDPGVHRPLGGFDRGRELGELHLDVPAHVHLVGVRGAGEHAELAAAHRRAQPVHDT